MLYDRLHTQYNLHEFILIVDVTKVCKVAGIAQQWTKVGLQIQYSENHNRKQKQQIIRVIHSSFTRKLRSSTFT